LTLPLLAAAFVASACHHGAAAADDDGDAGASGAVTGTDPTGSAAAPATPSGPAGTGLATGLPCDVQGIIENRCIACHGATPSGPPPLLSYDDLAAPSTMDPSKSRAQMAVQLLQSKEMPPPPAVPPADDEIASFAAWVAAGTPKNTAACTDPPPAAVDGGAAFDGGAGACVSGKFWQNGDDGSQLMHPGRNCNACHQLNDGPNLRIAGTVFHAQHEPDDCDGVSPPPQLTVIITDAKNKTIQLTVNQAGNFLTENRVNLPIHAQVTDGKNTRKMTGSVTSGDCNSCHTVAGANGAPGRIMAP
jgi:mono/diheme cytochrome c family protein